jgi:DNA invertase Pin-like site-specific DNA recombinase
VSTQDQTSGLESQVRTLRDFCDKNNIHNVEIFTDEGISGAKANRPALDRMMKLVREGRVERVVCYSFSRYARSVTHLLTALEEFRKFDTAFVSYTESVDTNSPMGRAFFTVIAAISQLERELIQERVRNGLKNARAKGKHIGRVKTRPSPLIRQLLAKGLPYRTIASICGISHGSIWAEKRAILLEEQEAKTKVESETNAQLFADSSPPVQTIAAAPQTQGASI